MQLRLAFVFRALIAGACFFLAACASFSGRAFPRNPEETSVAPADSQSVAFILIEVVHGDADYAYHDTSGKRHEADEEAVRQALKVAQASSDGDVFIFHQIPVHFRWFRRMPDGIFYHYRCGRRLQEEEYYRNAAGADFGAEVELFRRYSCRAPVKFFAYFGHEIPGNGGAGYSASYPERKFSLAELTRGLRGFAPAPDSGKKPFSLVVISTCYGGTPATMAALAPYADYAVASPANLHLSFFDLRSFQKFSQRGNAPFTGEDAHALALDVARQSFDRLKANTQTEITVAVYDMKKVSPYLKNSPSVSEPDNCGPDRGVELLYRPPRFGQDRNRATRSGWECTRN